MCMGVVCMYVYASHACNDHTGQSSTFPPATPNSCWMPHAYWAMRVLGLEPWLCGRATSVPLTTEHLSNLQGLNFKWYLEKEKKASITKNVPEGIIKDGNMQ